jgi:hypothetical protein
MGDPVEEGVETIEASTDVDTTAEGYDEAVEGGIPSSAEHEILAQNSVDPVALTEADPISEDELLLQDVGRDLRPEEIIPAPEEEVLELLELEFGPKSEDENDSSAELDSASAPEPEVNEEAAPVESATADVEESTDAPKNDAAL